MEVVSTSPENDDEGLPLGSLISVTFDEEVDPDSIRSGAFVVSSSASRLVVQGPGMEDLSPFGPIDYLESDVFTGIIDGSIATEDNLTFTFTPKRPLLPNATYKILLGTNIVTRTIGDVVPADGNTSTGTIETKGPYTGGADTIVITIVSSGLLGVATFSYHKESSGMESSPIPTDRLVEIEDGLYLKFKSGTFVEGDTFECEVYDATPLEEIFSFTFYTGSASYVEPNDAIPSFKIEKREVEGLTRLDSSVASDSSTLALVSIVPANEASNVPLGFETITLTFNKDIDPECITDIFVEVLMESLPLDETQQISVPLPVSVTINGPRVILRFRG